MSDLPPEMEARLDLGYDLAKLYGNGPVPRAPDAKIVAPRLFFWLADDEWRGWEISCSKHPSGILVNGRPWEGLRLAPLSGSN